MSGGVLSRKVVVTTPYEPIDVVFASANSNQYSEALSVAGLASATILSFTVPLGKVYKMQNIYYAGENKAQYEVQLNTNTIAKQSAYYTSLNGTFSFNNLEFIAGDIIDIVVENGTNTIANFNANMIGRIDNA